MRGVVTMPEIADAKKHRIARGSPRFAEDSGLAVRGQNALKDFSIGARSGANVIPPTVGHDEVLFRAENKRRLQSTGHFSKFWVSAHGNAHGPPIGPGQVFAFPSVKQPCLAFLRRAANAGPQLPSMI